MGAILVQKLPGNIEHALAYFSKALNDTQRCYSFFNLEPLAVHSAVKHFEHMLLDRSFTIVMDHLSLVHTFQKPSPSHSPQQSRQLSYLTEFNCTFEHIAGQKNCTVDCLSRLVIHNISAQDSLNITLQDISKEQQHCMATNRDLFRFPNDSTVNLQWVDLEHGSENCRVLVNVARNQQRIVIPPSRGGIEDTRLEAEAKDTKKSEAKDSPSVDRPSRGQGQECSRPRTKDTGASVLKIFFSGDLRKKKFSKKIFASATVR